ncbi:MAG: hypothetical protein QOF12_455 [Solirubrobacteraceae bacterium]|jgi:hypothetical protein|nr:hypothetical protein [Gaiellaceae bacterium]MDX6639444.1 hypothetical protein [Solirubrobacteraceae bacterium]
MHAPRVHHKATAPLLAVMAAIVFLACSQAGSAAVAQLPFTVTNNSGRGDATYIYVIARNSAGAQGYVDGGGTWRAWSFPSSTPNGPVAAPDVSIAGPGNGASKTITLPPSLAGGRIYLSMGSKLSFFLTTNGLVEPAAWVASDANANVLYDWTEFARASSAGNGIFINTTTVDMFSVPLTVSVTSSAGVTQTQGIPGNRTGILNAFTALGAPWSSLITTRSSDGLPLRVLAPVHAIANGSFSSTYLDAYITAAWSYYATHTLTVQTGLGNFTGTTSGNNWTFRDASGNVIGTLTKPTTSDTFACAGGTQPGGQPNETAILAVGARVCAALNRATLSTSSRVMFDTQPTTDATQFYGQTASNLFSKTIHANSLNGLAYGFSYDDVGGFAPVIDQPDPASAAMTIGSFGTSGGGTGGGGGGGGGVSDGIAQGKPTTASSSESATYPASAATDGNNATRWSSAFSDPQWIQVDLGQSYNVTQVTLSWEAAYGKAFQIQTSPDGAAWTTIYSTTTGTGGIQTLNVTGTGRYVRMYGTVRGSAYGYSLWDFGIQGTVASGGGGGGGITPGAWYQVVNQNSSSCVDDSAGGTANGTSVQQWACVTGSTNQGWQFRATDSGYYNVLNRTSAAQNEVWDVTGGAGTVADGAKIQTWAYGGGTNQQWQPVSLGNGFYKMVARNSGKCLDVPAASTANGVQLQQHTCNGTAAQAWKLVQQA